NFGALLVVSGDVETWDIRAHVEVSSWPQHWDPSGQDIRAPIEGAGILRRLGQGASPLRSPLARLLPRTGSIGQTAVMTDPVAYWPLEDGEQATRAASGLPGGQPAAMTGTIEWA